MVEGKGQYHIEWCIMDGPEWLSIARAPGVLRKKARNKLTCKRREGGVIEQIARIRSADDDLEYLSIDSTFVTLHQSVNDGKKEANKKPQGVLAAGQVLKSIRSLTVWGIQSIFNSQQETSTIPPWQQMSYPLQICHNAISWATKPVVPMKFQIIYSVRAANIRPRRK